MAVEQTTLRDELILKLNRRPFQAFSVTLSDGTRHFIVRVAQMGIGMTIGTIAEPAGDRGRHIKLSEITELKDL